MRIMVTNYIRVIDVGLSYSYDIKREYKGETKWRNQGVYFRNPEIAIKDAIKNHMRYKTRNKEFNDINEFIEWKKKEISNIIKDIDIKIEEV